jgi:antitoxin component of MazEF toxin-antitoxin module
MKFTAKIYKLGTSHVITIPRLFIKEGMLNFHEEVEITINKKEVELNATNTQKAQHDFPDVGQNGSRENSCSDRSTESSN